MTIGASDWLVFDMTWQTFQDRFWKDNPYVMLKTLGYRFHTREGDYAVGLHFERYPPEFSARPDDEISFWITVSSAGSDIRHMA